VPGDEVAAVEAPPVSVQWPPERSTVQIPSGRYVRVDVDPDADFARAGKTFSTRATANSADEDEVTVLPGRKQRVDVHIESASVTFVLERRAANANPKDVPTIIVGSRPFDVRPLDDGVWVGIKLFAGKDIDVSSARAFETGEVAAATPDAAVLVPNTAGKYMASILSPDAKVLRYFYVEVGRQVSSSLPKTPVTPRKGGSRGQGAIKVPADAIALEADGLDTGRVSARRSTTVVPADLAAPRDLA